MKNFSTLFKLQLLVVFVLSICVANSFAQQAKEGSRYVSTKFKFSFETPEGTALRTSTPSGDELIYKALGIRLRFMVFDDAKMVSEPLKSKKALDNFVQSLIAFQEKVAKDESWGGDLFFNTPETKPVQISGIDSVRFDVLAESEEDDSENERYIGFVIPAREHKRIYVFVINIPDKKRYLDSWLPVVEKTVNSFTLIKPESK